MFTYPIMRTYRNSTFKPMQTRLPIKANRGIQSTLLSMLTRLVRIVFLSLIMAYLVLVGSLAAQFKSAILVSILMILSPGGAL